MKSTELLSYISDLEIKLSSFSFEELTSDEAQRLKKSFNSFKNNLERKSSLELYKPSNLEKNDNERENFELAIAKVSHEMRTPLNGIIGFTDLLQEAHLSEQQASYVSAIKTASNNLLTIINGLLEYSKNSSGVSHVKTINFNFHHLIKDVCYLCKTLIVNEKVEFNYTISAHIPSVLKGDPSKLSQILLNLIGNAIKFVERGTIDLNIQANSLSKDKVTLVFSLKDTGIGIAKESLETIFDYYTQADKEISKNYGGTGLGLGIVKQLVHSLQGEISVTSELNVGTCFVFSVPYEVVSETKNLQLHEPELLNIDSIALRDKKILVFEDNTMNQKLIQNRLQRWGSISFITDDVNEGLAILESHKIDVVLMDLRLPETNGFTIAKQIRAHKNTHINTVPIIAVTADFNSKDKALCEKSGINDFVLKPFDAQQLLEKIKNMIFKKAPLIEEAKNTVKSGLNRTEVIEPSLEPLFEECLQDIDMLEELVELFKVNVVEFIGKTKVDLKKKNFEGIRFSAHKIKASLKMMQLNGLLRIVEQMHKSTEEDHDVNYLNFLYDCFIKEYPIIENDIENSLVLIKNSQ